MKKTVFFGLLAMVLAFGFIGCEIDNNYTVTFNLDGGNINGNTSSVQISVESGGTIDNLPNPQRTGYSFGGWFTGTNGAGNQFTTTTVVTENRTVFANWTNGGGDDDNPFKGTWMGTYNVPEMGEASFTLIIGDSSFETSNRLISTGYTMKQRGTYEIDGNTIFSDEITEVDVIENNVSITGGWSSDPDDIWEYSGSFEFTLTNGQLVSPIVVLTKTNSSETIAGTWSGSGGGMNVRIIISEGGSTGYTFIQMTETESQWYNFARGTVALNGLEGTLTYTAFFDQWGAQVWEDDPETMDYYKEAMGGSLSAVGTFSGTSSGSTFGAGENTFTKE